MDRIIYRDLTKNDYASIKQLIGEAFGINKFIQDKKVLDSILDLYLQSCIVSSSFSKVAEKDNKVIGIILGDSKKDKNRLRKPHNYLITVCSFLKLAISSKENKKLLKRFSKIQDTYKEIIKGKEDKFQGCIQLFIVSKEFRGLGIGKALVNKLFNYMKSEDVKSIYLYTDSICNYKFYESQNFQRLNEKQISFNDEFDLDVFLYGYEF